MGVKSEAKAIHKAGTEAGNAAYDAFRNFSFKAKPGAATVEAVAEAPGVMSKIGAAFAAPFKGAAKAGLWVVEQPLALVMKPVKWTLNGATTAFSKYPRLAPVAAVTAALVGTGTYISHRSAKNRQAELAQEAYAAQAQMNAASARSSSPYSVTPEEYAAMEARMRTGSRQGGHVDAVNAARQQTAETAAAL